MTDKGLLIAALVAIVAVVGLVILSSGGNTGAAVCGHLEMTQLGSGEWALICKQEPSPAVAAFGNPDIRHEGVVWNPGQQIPYMVHTTQVYQPFAGVQEADARRKAIAQGGYGAVQ